MQDCEACTQAPATIGSVCAHCWVEIASDIFRLLDDVCDVLDAAGDGHGIMLGRTGEGRWRASLVAVPIGPPPCADGHARGLPDAIKHLRETVIR
jgi:hypothetical protein